MSGRIFPSNSYKCQGSIGIDSAPRGASDMACHGRRFDTGRCHPGPNRQTLIQRFECLETCRKQPSWRLWGRFMCAASVPGLRYLRWLAMGARRAHLTSRPARTAGHPPRRSCSRGGRGAAGVRRVPITRQRIRGRQLPLTALMEPHPCTPPRRGTGNYLRTKETPSDYARPRGCSCPRRDTAAEPFESHAWTTSSSPPSAGCPASLHFGAHTPRTLPVPTPIAIGIPPESLIGLLRNTDSL